MPTADIKDCSWVQQIDGELEAPAFNIYLGVLNGEVDVEIYQVRKAMVWCLSK